MNFWTFRRQGLALDPHEQLRLLCLQMANGDLTRAASYRDWIVRNEVPMAAVGGSIGPKREPSVVKLFEAQKPEGVDQPEGAA